MSAYALAYRLLAQHHSALAHAIRDDAGLSPERRADSIAHHETQAAYYADRAARYEAEAMGEPA